MVILRHGSLEDFSKVMYSYYYIAKIFKSTYNVVHRIVARFKDRGCHDDMRQNANLIKQVPAEMVEYLKARDTLQRWAHLSMRRRVYVIQEMWKVKLST